MFPSYHFFEHLLTTVAPLDIVVDVGGVYSPEEHRYDHHQRGFDQVFGYGGFDKTKLSSAGLVYKHFGKEIIANHLGLSQDHPNTEVIWLTLYSEFIESIDAIDNGINISSAPLNYTNRSDLSSRVKRINPNWNEPATEAVYDAKFEEASKMTGQEFIEQLDYFGKAWLPARDIVKEAVEKRTDIDESGAIVVLNQSCPWKDHLFAIEPELKPTSSKILYILYPEGDEPGSKWRIQCVPVNPDSFENRKSMPEAWRGVRDDALSKVAGIDGLIFCHASGFIGGAQTYEGALEMARKSLAA